MPDSLVVPDNEEFVWASYEDTLHENFIIQKFILDAQLHGIILNSDDIVAVCVDVYESERFVAQLNSCKSMYTSLKALHNECTAGNITDTAQITKILKTILETVPDNVTKHWE